MRQLCREGGFDATKSTPRKETPGKAQRRREEDRQQDAAMNAVWGIGSDERWDLIIISDGGVTRRGLGQEEEAGKGAGAASRGRQKKKAAQGVRSNRRLCRGHE